MSSPSPSAPFGDVQPDLQATDPAARRDASADQAAQRAGAGGGPRRLIVVSGPKPGAGRTRLVAGLAVALLRNGVKAGVVDADVGERALAAWLARRGRLRDLSLVMPAAPIAPVTPARDVGAAEREFVDAWPSVRAAFEQSCDIALVDAPAGDGLLARRLHEDADVVITLAAHSEDSLEGVFDADAGGRDAERPANYGRMLWEARRRQAVRRADGAFDWFLIAGRADPGASDVTAKAARQLGARPGPAVRDDAAWRSGWRAGRCVSDAGEGSDAARQAIRDVLIGLRVPALAGASLAL